MLQELLFSEPIDPAREFPQSPRVLILSDREASCARLLRALDGEFAIARSGVQQWIRGGVPPGRPDVLLVDLTDQPSGDLGTLDLAHTRSGSTPVIVLVEESAEASGRRAVQLGAQDYLVTDEFSTPRARRAIWNAIERQRLQLSLVRVTERLHQSRQSFRALVDGNADGLVVVDAAGHVQYVNPAAEAVLTDRTDELIARVCRGASDTGPFDLDVVDRGGAPRTVEVRLARVPWHTGGTESTLATIREVTAQRAAERRLQDLAAALARSNADLEQFAYVASHDLQEPLRTISSYVTLIERRSRGRLDAEAETYLAYASQAARRMQQLIRDLLAYSRIGSAEIQLGEASCDAALDAALEHLRHAVDASGATITRDPLPLVRGDGSHLLLLFQNVVGNALKFRGPLPLQVHIGAARVDGAVRLSVTDNGVGVAPRHRDRIFEIFQRLHTADEYPGTGMGLAICKRIVERHGGRMWAEAATPNGLRVCWTLQPA